MKKCKYFISPAMRVSRIYIFMRHIFLRDLLRWIKKDGQYGIQESEEKEDHWRYFKDNKVFEALIFGVYRCVILNANHE